MVHRLPEREPVRGVTSLAGKIYLLRTKELEQVEVYDVITFTLHIRLTVPNAKTLVDMTSCEHNCCIYIADADGNCMHKREAESASFSRWEIHDQPCGLSVNTAHNVLVTCLGDSKIKEFSSHGDLLREVILHDEVVNPYHAIQIPSTEFILCFGGIHTIRGVRKLSADGLRSVESDGGAHGPYTGQQYRPCHLALDDNGCVLVSHSDCKRVTLLSPRLQYVRQIVSPEQLKFCANKIHLDVRRRLLYVEDYTRVVVIRINKQS